MQKVERGIRRCLKFITEGDGDPGMVRDQLRILEMRKKELDADLAAPPEDTKIELHPNVAELYRRKVNELHKLLQDDETKPRAVEIIRSLVERVEILPRKERGQCDVVLFGALAQILAYSHQKNTAASNGDDGTCLMVAGEGFEPTTCWE